MLCSLIPDTFCKKGKRDYEKAKFEKYLSCLLEPPNLNDLGQLGFIGAHVGFFLFKTSRLCPWRGITETTTLFVYDFDLGLSSTK